MYSYIDISKIHMDEECRQKLGILLHRYMKHEFSLLGSGYITINYAIKAQGFQGVRYVDRKMPLYEKTARARLKNKCTASYEPMNWFVDYKSGFFFHPRKYASKKKCYKVMNEKKGVDIKCPWELGRLYHLLQMAVLAVDYKMLRSRIILEFKNEVIDFIEMNPVGKTVQWVSPMDVSVRVVNMVLAYDIFRQLDAKEYLDRTFQAYFEKHISKTLTFIMEHLEYIGKVNTNHYLSNIAGIIFAAAYLKKSNWTDACLVFGVQELIENVKSQFYEEGAHFEGSTSYHRLSTEFVFYPMAFVYGILKSERKEAFLKYNSDEIERLKKWNLQKYDLDRTDFFPEWFINRVYNAGIFTELVLKNNNEIVQIGDNDSGRLIKLTPLFQKNDLNMEENDLDHRSLLSAMSGIFSDKKFEIIAKELPLESGFIYSLAGQKQTCGKAYVSAIERYGNNDRIRKRYEYKKTSLLYEDHDHNLLDGAEIYYFGKFGVLVCRGKRLFVSLVLDTAKSGVYVGHTHNDKLSVEIMVDGKYITRDSGGYVYTAAPEIRDRFRSIKAHNNICVKEYEQNEFDGIWGMKKRASVKLLYCSRNRILAKAVYGDVECMREICLSDHGITIHDFANKPFDVSFHNKIYSDGYGKIKKVIR